jgi:hypothetical protein
VVAWRQNWAEDRVYFEDERKKLRSLPSQWTSLVCDDPALVVGAGRAQFRVADLLELVTLLKEKRAELERSGIRSCGRRRIRNRTRLPGVPRSQRRRKD